MENKTLKIDAQTHDIVLDDGGGMVMIGGAETTAQCVRVTLEIFTGEWFLDLGHGTDYDQIIADGTGDAETVFRTAIHQEKDVRYIDEIEITKTGRQLSARFSGRLKDGTAINMEVGA